MGHAAAVVILFTAPYRSRDPDRLDITRAGCDRATKAGAEAPGVFLAPSAALVFPALAAMKAARTDDERESVWAGYVEAYRGEMRASYRQHRAAWDALLARPRAVLVCFCADPAHCHRSLAATFLAKCGADYRGELPP